MSNYLKNNYLKILASFIFNILYYRRSVTIFATIQNYNSIYNQTLINEKSINMHLRFKVLHRVFRYIKLMYNYPHDKKEDHFKVIKSLITLKTYLQVYTRQKANQLRSYHL